MTTDNFTKRAAATPETISPAGASAEPSRDVAEGAHTSNKGGSLLSAKRMAQAIAVTLITATASVATAQDAAAVQSPPPGEEQADNDGVRFRGGVSGGGGALIFSGATAGIGGVDGRLGVQIMDLIGIYLQPQMALGVGSGLFAGSFGASALVDVTLIDQIFVGAGGGAGLVQFGGTDSGGVLHFRAGGYPLVGSGEDGIRRKGLMLGADLRLHFAAGAVLVSPMVSIGYEAF